MGRKSKIKGRKFQAALARWMREELDLGEFWSNTAKEAQQGAHGDVIDTDPPLERFPLAVECKHGASPSPWAALKQALEGAKASRRPLAAAMIRRNGGEDIVVMTPEHWAVLAMMARQALLDYADVPTSPENVAAGILSDVSGWSKYLG